MAKECPNCVDGWVMSEGKAHRCTCAVERVIATRLPARYVSAAITDLSAELRSLVTGFMQKPGAGLLIIGPVGSGKTHLAATLIRTLILSGSDARFVTAERFYADLREAHRTGASEGSVFDSFENSTFLVIDDLGAGSLSDHERRSTLALLDRRINTNRPTIVTTNWDLERIAKLMDDRIASRLAAFTMMELSGPDLRLHRTRGTTLHDFSKKGDKNDSRR